MKYRKKPGIVEAIKWTGENLKEIEAFTIGARLGMTEQNGIIIIARKGQTIAEKGNYIVKVREGQFYPCDPDIFESAHTLEKTPQFQNDPPCIDLPIKDGDLVILKSGGPIMTAGGPATNKRIRCHWFNDVYAQYEELSPAALRHVSAEEQNQAKAMKGTNKSA